MLARNVQKVEGMPSGFDVGSVIRYLRPSLWQLIAIASCAAGVGSGWRVLLSQADLVSPITATVVMMLVTFAGWYVWGFFTYLSDQVLFGGHANYQGTLNAFGRAYIFQILFVFIFTQPIGWLWGWIALYLTVAAWGIIGPRHLGMRTWQAILASTLGMLMWLAVLTILSMSLSWDGLCLGLGVFLA